MRVAAPDSHELLAEEHRLIADAQRGDRPAFAVHRELLLWSLTGLLVSRRKRRRWLACRLRRSARLRLLAKEP